MSNSEYLYERLLTINSTYETASFIDIDFIELFNIQETSDIKKAITSKYYSLALKYHPDKYRKKTEDIVINNTLINIDEIKNGLFLSFINDIYKTLIDMISIDVDILINLLKNNKESILNLNYGGDHKKLSQSYRQQEILPTPPMPTDESIQTTSLKDTISEIKISNEEIAKLIEDIKLERSTITIEKVFTDDDIQSESFYNKFNDKFNNEQPQINIESNSNQFNNILAYNESTKSIQQKDQSTYIANSSKISKSISITDINEAFKPIEIDRKVKLKKITYEELLIIRQTENDNFKVAKNFKSS